MVKPASKRLVRRLDLELFLSQLDSHPSPQACLEQYTISEAVAATILNVAAYANDDIIGKKVLDLGCGTGRLALAASYLGADSTVGIDIDQKAIETAIGNVKKTGIHANIQWIVGDLDAVMGTFDTVLQNPPFGVQKRAADRRFLEKAMGVSQVVYSLHNHPCTDKKLLRRLNASPERLLRVAPSLFLENFVKRHNCAIKAVFAMPMSIPRMFNFHTQNRHDFIVDLYHIEKNK